MPKFRKDLTDEKRAEIVRRYAAGENGRLLGEEFGIHPNYVRVLAQRSAGWVARPRLKRRIKPVDEVPRRRVARGSSLPVVSVAEVRRLSARGVSETAIAALLRVPYREVAAALEAGA